MLGVVVSEQRVLVKERCEVFNTYGIGVVVTLLCRAERMGREGSPGERIDIYVSRLISFRNDGVIFPAGSTFTFTLRYEGSTDLSPKQAKSGASLGLDLLWSTVLYLG